MIHDIKQVEIEWIDSKSGPCGWEDWDDLDPLEPIKCKTVGFLVESTDDYKVIASSISGKFVLGRLVIPQHCILEVKVLKYGKGL